MDVKSDISISGNASGCMSEPFLQLPETDRSEILRSAAAELGISAQILEKDVWVCWALGKLFQMPSAKPMAFKGGTSLSKIWGAIYRFSEDIDVTIDYRAFDTGFDHRAGNVSSNQRKQITEELRAAVKDYTSSTVLPYFEKQLRAELPGSGYEITLSDCGEKLFLKYPSVVTGELRNSYILDSVLLEFGGRNTLEPNADHTVTAYMQNANEVQGVSFPEAHDVVAIDVFRTFWEKVTLIHAACGKDPARIRADRMSRHWYDLHMLVAGGAVDLNAALENRALLEEVVAIKNVFFYAGSAKYDHCLKGGLILEPEQGLLERVAKDYEEMRDMNLVAGEPPVFDEILKSIHEIQIAANTRFG